MDNSNNDRQKNRKPSKREIAYQVIRERILNDTYGPGFRIIISQLAQELESSAIPIREAIRQLEAERLIDYKQFSGAVVSPVNEGEYLETLTTLAILSGATTALSSKYFPKDQVDNLVKINKSMEEALGDLDFISYGKLNRDFHQLSYSYCNNDYLVNQTNASYDHLDKIRRTGSTFLFVRAKESIDEHYEIIKLIKMNTPAQEIENYVRQHKLKTVEAYKSRKKSMVSPTIL